MAKLLGDAKALMLRGHGAVVVGQSIREVCMLGLFLEESARLQVEAMRLGTPMFMERDETEKIAKRTSRRLQWTALGIIWPRNASRELLAGIRRQISTKS